MIELILATIAVIVYIVERLVVPRMSREMTVEKKLLDTNVRLASIESEHRNLMNIFLELKTSPQSFIPRLSKVEADVEDLKIQKALRSK